jgi:phosphate/sulfate permease
MNINIDQTSLIIIVLVILCVFGILIGYILGRISTEKGVSNTKPKSFFDKEHEKKEDKISIDDTKYVIDIKTTGLEKKYSSLGDKKESDENIESSINKLKNMKG